VPSIIPDNFEAASKDCGNRLLSLNPFAFTGVNLEDNQNLNLLHTLFGFKVWAEAATSQSICPVAFWLHMSSFSGIIENCSSCSVCTSASQTPWNLPQMQEYVAAEFRGAQINQRSLISPPTSSRANVTALSHAASQQLSLRKPADSSSFESAVPLQNSYSTFIAAFWRGIIKRCADECILCHEPTCYGYYSGSNPCKKLRAILGLSCCHYCGFRSMGCEKSECYNGGNLKWPKPGIQRNICIHCLGNDPMDSSCVSRVHLRVKAVVLAALHEMEVSHEAFKVLFENLNDPSTARAIRLSAYEYTLVVLDRQTTGSCSAVVYLFSSRFFLHHYYYSFYFSKHSLLLQLLSTKVIFFIFFTESLVANHVAASEIQKELDRLKSGFIISVVVIFNIFFNSLALFIFFFIVIIIIYYYHDYFLLLLLLVLS
jgi:hypothetical protein